MKLVQQRFARAVHHWFERRKENNTVLVQIHTIVKEKLSASRDDRP